MALQGEVLVLEAAYEEITKKPMTKVPTGGIGWLHRKEYIIVNNEVCPTPASMLFVCVTFLLER